MEKHIKHLSKSRLAESIGWIGALAILGSYSLLSFNFIEGDSIIYHLMMLVGSLGLAIITYRHRAFQSFMVNVAFSLLAVAAIVRLTFFA